MPASIPAAVIPAPIPYGEPNPVLPQLMVASVPTAHALDFHESSDSDESINQVRQL